MNYLAIDTSGTNLTVVICANNKYYEYFNLECGLKHSSLLMPIIEQLAKDSNFDFSKADFLSCTIGPGSFTGIRIGVATIKALCFAYNLPCIAVATFDTLAYNKEGGRVLSVIDAKHDGFYVCGYNDFAIDFSPSYIMKEQLLELMANYDKVVSFSDIKDINTEKVSVLDGLKIAISKKINEKTFDLEKLTPLYVRKSQAEEGR